MKGFRDKIDKQKIMKEMDDQDWQRMQEQQKYFKLKDISPLRAKVILHNDDYRRDCDKAKLTILEHLTNIRDLKATMKRHQIEIESGDIKTEFKNGLKMNNEELHVMIEKQKKMCVALAQDIMPQLAKIQAYVGSVDISKRIIITEDEFAEYTADVEKQLADMGEKLFKW